MFNPLLDDLSALKDEELSSKINELTKKYTISARLGNGSLGQQIIVTLEAMRMEMSRRQYEASKQLLSKQNKDLDGLINID